MKITWIWNTAENDDFSPLRALRAKLINLLLSLVYFSYESLIIFTFLLNFHLSRLPLCQHFPRFHCPLRILLGSPIYGHIIAPCCRVFIAVMWTNSLMILLLLHYSEFKYGRIPPYKCPHVHNAALVSFTICLKFLYSQLNLDKFLLTLFSKASQNQINLKQFTKKSGKNVTLKSIHLLKASFPGHILFLEKSVLCYPTELENQSKI